jgi:predicted SnoaL-like aldol condensation-catalyzing enzyme
VGAKKDAAVSFLRLTASGRVREAYTNHVGAAFRHHNPFFAGDAQALMTGMEENARQNPNKQLDILRALEDGDFVAVHSRVRQNPGDRGAALAHIFRFEGDRIAELWDIGQPVPAESANANGMF